MNHLFYLYCNYGNIVTVGYVFQVVAYAVVGPKNASIEAACPNLSTVCISMWCGVVWGVLCVCVWGGGGGGGQAISKSSG